MAYIGFNADQIPDSSGFDPLPAGDYMVWISESKVQTSQNGHELLKVTYEGMQPEQEGFFELHHRGPEPRRDQDRPVDTQECLQSCRGDACTGL